MVSASPISLLARARSRRERLDLFNKSLRMDSAAAGWLVQMDFCARSKALA